MKSIYLSFFIFSIFSLHKYYVSVMEIHPNFEKKKIEIVLRTFPDDMERAIKDNFHVSSNNKRYDEYLKIYLKHRIRFGFDNEKTDYNILGSTLEDDFIVFLFEIDIPENAKLLQIDNTLLFDEYDSQKNIVHFINSSERKSYILIERKHIAEIKLNNY